MNSPRVSPDPVVVHEERGILGISKPARMDVFGDGSVCSWLLSARPELSRIGPPAEPAIVHRLDRGTSGLLLAASEQVAYDSLRRAFSDDRVDKIYLALVEGALAGPLDIDLELGARYRRSSKVRVASGSVRLRGVRPARTEVEPIGQAGGFTLCRVRIHSGIRHQIRVHLSHLGHPVAGDGLYGASLELADLEDRSFLHAWQVTLDEEIAGCRLRWSCLLPGDLERILSRLGMSQG